MLTAHFSAAAAHSEPAFVPWPTVVSLTCCQDGSECKLPGLEIICGFESDSLQKLREFHPIYSTELMISEKQ